MECKGIDVAKWNHEVDKNGNLINFDWKKIKDSGVQFVISKVINKQCKEEDSFRMNYNGAISVGLPVDVYNYSYATTVSKAVSDAKTVLSVIKGKNIGCVWLDVEDKIQMNLGMTLIDIINAYQEVIEKAGYKFGVYTGLSFYNTCIKPYHSFLDCNFWIARYPSSTAVDLSFEPLASKKPVIMHPLWGWQYTSTGRIDGINGNVDLSIRYDYAITNQVIPRKILRKGDFGIDVSYLQQRLTIRGYGVGTIDSKFGAKTLKAVKAFQEEHNLTVDGVVGSKTWAALG